MIEYVLGFRISGTHAALIKKKRPSRQKGLFNGVGGKIEGEETPAAAMTREFQEETSKVVLGWDHFATIESPYTKVYCFRSFGDFDGIKTMTD